MDLNKKEQAELIKVYDTWLYSYLNGDVKTYDFYLDDKYRFVGSTGNEEFLNRSDTTKFFAKTADQLAGKTDLKNNHRTIEKIDGIVFVTELFDASFLIDSKWKFYGRFRFTSALSKKKEGWRFIYQHFSMPDAKAQEGETLGAEQISLENQQLKDAIKRRTIELEQKNRELEIEASLERVRSKSMAMRKSKDIGDTVSTLFGELLKIGIHKTSRSGIGILNESKYMKLWSGITNSAGEIDLQTGILDMTIAPLLKNVKRAWEMQNENFFYELKGKELFDYYDSINNSNEYSLEIDLSKLPKKETADIFPFKHGIIYSFNNIPIPEEAKLIFKRFALVFEQTYTRFLDIEKAEKQAREAKIEAALERVRSRSMAMRNSEELANLSLELVKQVQTLGKTTWFCAFNIYDDDPKGSLEWGSNGEGIFPKYRTPREGVFLRYYEAGQRGEALLINEIGSDECPAHYQYLCTLPGVGDQLQIMKDEGIPFPASQIDHAAYFKYGYILFITYDPVPELHAVFKRFAKVFEQSYTRFLDLQKAEEQALEAQIEAALERVRSRTMGMQRSDELKDAAMVLFEQIEALGVPTFASGFNIWAEDKKTATAWMARKDGFQPPFQTITAEDLYLPIYKAQQKGESLFVLEIGGKDLVAHYEYLTTIPVVKSIEEELLRNGLSFPEFQVIHCAFFSQGYLMFISYEPVPEVHDIFIRFAKVFEQTYTRFLDLQKVEAQVREAQIETALEKVRSRTMAMQKGEEVKDVVVLLYKELIALGVTNFTTCGYVEVNEKTNRQLTWVTNPGGDSLGLFYLPLTGDAIFDERYNAWKKQQIVFHQTVAGKKRREHLEYAITTFNSKEAEEMVLNQFPDPTVFYCFNFSHGYLHIVSGSKLKKDEEALLARFTKVFQQTYARFLDLQKAEAQAIEAQIETALERVRSRSMAMHKSDELKEVVKVIFDQMAHLKINTDHAGIVVDYEPKKDFSFWVADNQDIPSKITVPYLDLVWNRQFTEAKKKGKNFFTTQLDFEEKSSFYKKLLPHIEGLTKQAWDFYLNCPGLAASTVIQKDIGLYIENFSGISFSDEENSILMRLGKVFQQAYTRFIDLQKAEERAREAQIEASLERIRGQVTAMKASTELLDIVVSMRSEFVNLGHQAHYFWHMRWLPNIYQKAMTSGDGTRIGMVMELPRHIHGNIELINQWEKGDKPTVIYAMDAETSVNYVNKMIDLGNFEQIDHNAPGPDDLRKIGGLTFVMARTTHGEIGYSLPGVVESPPEESLATLVRFAKAFDLAYKRFEDLIRTEQQTREAQIELALERVRARSLAMQKPEELKDVARVLRVEMGALGIDALETCSIYINDKKSKTAECWYALKDVQKRKKQLIADHLTINYNDTWVSREMLKFYNSKKDKISIIMTGKNRIEWIRYCENLSIPFRGYYEDKIPDRIYHLFKFSNGFIGVATVSDISEENWRLLKRVASVFSLAYSRFKDLSQARSDLQKLKEEKQRAESALNELKATQTQLIQSEKMASLGELTAGIAHEIQNPLNFVNNFSELSEEMLEELADEIIDNSDEIVTEIMTDLKQNLNKITNHGKRASSIVKGMLDHSRTGSSERVVTDINKLANEFLRLSYHGLRAKDKSFNATFKTDFDTSLPKVKIIAQDLGRVILNLINNAFYACIEQNRSTDDSNYKPTVTVSTKKIAAKVEIQVKDNGSGIPDKIKDKIFQPFFTTKPTGEGTGLGLSLAYDIITKGHGGTLTVDSKKGKFTKFTIVIPE